MQGCGARQCRLSHSAFACEYDELSSAGRRRNVRTHLHLGSGSRSGDQRGGLADLPYLFPERMQGEFPLNFFAVERHSPEGEASHGGVEKNIRENATLQVALFAADRTTTVRVQLIDDDVVNGKFQTIRDRKSTRLN